MDIKRIVIFGATGRTGRQLLKQALEGGYQVTAIVRNPESLQDFKRYENLEVKKGNAVESESFETYMENCDAVMSCLGGTGSRFATMSFYEDAMKAMHKAMNSHGITRFVGMTSWATQDDIKLPFFVRWLLRPLLIKHILDSMYEMEQYTVSTDLNYTIVRPPGLQSGDSAGKEIKVLDKGQCISGCANYMPMSDVAAFMLNCLKTGKHGKKIVAIGIES